MSKTYRPYDPEQQLLLPAALQEWLPPEHMAYFISDVVDELDLSVIMARYEGEERGGPPYHPRMLVKVLLYGYCIGAASSRASPGVSTRTLRSGCWRRPSHPDRCGSESSRLDLSYEARLLLQTLFKVRDVGAADESNQVKAHQAHRYDD